MTFVLPDPGVGDEGLCQHDGQPAHVLRCLPAAATSSVVFSDSNAFNAELRLLGRSGAGTRVGAARFFSLFMAPCH